MTVSTLNNKVTYVGNGSATQFAVPFKVLDEDHLVVKRRLLSSNEIVYTYIGTDYSYDGIGDDAGTLTLDGAALSSLYQLEIERIVPYTQPLDIVNSGGFYPETVEEQLDLTTMQVQQIAAQSDDIATRALLVPVGDVAPDYEDFADAFKGDPGGNIMAIGLFTAASGLIIPEGTSAVYTSGHTVLGVGAARYVESEDVDEAFVSAHPALAFISADDRGFILDKEQRLTGGMIGCLADCNQDDFTGTDIAPLIEAAWDAFEYHVDFALIAIGPTIYFEPGDYKLGSELEPRRIVQLIGTGTGHNNFIGGTRFHSPVDTRAITINIQLSGGGTKLLTNSGTADGTLIQGIQFISQGGTDPDAHAIWVRGRVTLRDCIFGEYRNADLTKGKWPGNAIHIVGNVGSSGADYGNASCFRIRDCYVERCERHGLFISGTDANAGSVLGFETKFCGGCGILDISGLGGNFYAGYHLAGWNNTTPYKGYVVHGGRQYQLISAVPDIGGATEPGTNNLIWYDMGADSSDWPDWVALGDYYPAVPILCTGASTRSNFAGGYSEGGTSHVEAPAIALPGQMAFTATSSVIQQNQIGLVYGIMCPLGMGGSQSYLSGQPGYAEMGSVTWTIVGGLDPDALNSRVLLNHRRAAASSSEMLWRWSGEDMTCAFGVQKPYFRMSGPLTTMTFGRASAVPYIFGMPQLAVVDPVTLGNSRIMNVCATIPGSGEVAKGERYWMNNAAAGGFAEQYCTTAGVLGSTAVMKTCNPISA